MVSNVSVYLSTVLPNNACAPESNVQLNQNNLDNRNMTYASMVSTVVIVITQVNYPSKAEEYSVSSINLIPADVF